MVWNPERWTCAGLALALFLTPGCQEQRDLIGDGGTVAGPILIRDGPALPDPATKPLVAQDPAPPDRVAPSHPPTPATGSIQPVSASGPAGDPSAAAGPVPGPAGTLTLGLSEAIETGLAQNPDLVTLRTTEGVGQALLGVAQAFPFNPTFQARVLPYNKFQNGTNASTYHYILVWQQFELAHQRQFRKQNAAAALDGTRWTIQQAELQNAAVTEQLYFAALYQRGLYELADLTAKLNGELLSVMEKRGQGGRASAAEVAMVRIDSASSRQQARLAEVGYRNALLALRRQLNVPPDVPLTLSGDLADFEWHPVTGPELCRVLGPSSEFTAAMDHDTLAGELAGRRPDVLAARANSQAARANVNLAEAARVPNLWLGPFYSRDSEAIVSVGLQTQMDIPVLNTGRPLVHQREAELRQQQTNAEQLEVRARIEARTALERYEQALRLHEQTRAEGAQELPQELQKLEAEFKRGEIDILRIFQARNSLLLLRRTHLDGLNELAQAGAALTAASGIPPAALVGPSCRP